MLNLNSIFFLIFCPVALTGQNIISNPSFEETYQGNFGVTKALDWVSPTQGTPDLMNNESRVEYHIPQNISGYQNALDGKSYFGFVLYSGNRSNTREYIQTNLIKKLKKDSIYCFQAYISLADSVKYAIHNNLGVHISTNAPNANNFDNIDLSPTIEFIDSSFFIEKVKWVKLAAQFKANGNEKFITIGNYKPDSLVNLITLHNGGSTQDAYNNTYYYIDKLYLGHCDSVPLDTSVGLREPILKRQISIYPNPTKENLFISYQGNEKLQLRLYNLHGQLLHFDSAQCDNCPNQNSSQLKLSVAHLPQGLYFLEIVAGEERISKKVIIE